MRRYSRLLWIAAGCALGAGGCAESDSEAPPERVAVTRQAVSQDLTPPDVDCSHPGDCALSTTAVDVKTGPATVGVTIRLVDSPAGFAFGNVVFESPLGGQAVGANLLAPPQSGTLQDGVYHGTLTFPEFAESGDWKVSYVWVGDAANNIGNHYAPELLAKGFPGTITVDSHPDSTPPAVCPQAGECTLSATQVDTTNGPATVGVTVHVLDSPAGFTYGDVVFESPLASQIAHATLVAPPQTGTAQDGYFHGNLTFPQHAEPGDWKLSYIWVVDAASNTTLHHAAELIGKMPDTISVTSEGDSDAPVACPLFGDCSLSTDSVDVSSAPATIGVTMRIVDDPAGFVAGEVAFLSPSGQSAGASLHGPPQSGDALDGVYQGTITIPQLSESGIWKTQYVWVQDGVGNIATHPASAVVANGFPAGIHVCHANDACNDGDVCTVGEACAAGYCGGGSPLDCDDGNRCTADSCNSNTGCAHTAISCDDGNPCTTDACHPAFGCTHAINVAPCDDGDACTTGDTCAAGKCVAGPPLDCDDESSCTLDVCAAGACVHLPQEGYCDEGDHCMSNKKCIDGACAGGDPIVCDDGEECTVDSCDSQVGCVFAPRAGSCGTTPGGCATGGACFQGHCTQSAVCGDKVCCEDGGENSCNCPADCQDPPGTPECGNGCCGANEDACTCPEDCQPVPNDQQCCGNETACNSADCGPDYCGNGCCGAGETTCSCPADCGTACDDGCCSPGEDACDCPEDCQPVKDGRCCGSENACNSLDCGEDTCGNKCCGPDETPCSCPADCGQVVCGDGTCAGCGEDKCSCPADCGPKDPSPCQDDCGSKCGDGCCGIRPDGVPETACNCNTDCATVCGDDCCSGDEDSCSCPGDCGSPDCGNGKCEACAGETPCGCPSDCGSADDGVCCGGENGCTAPDDCGSPAAGNHLCEACIGETSCNTPEDCTPVCGDGCCNGAENGCNCKVDCGAPDCGNERCEACDGETACSCPGDCGGPDACGDGLCCGGESSCGCVADCGGVVHGDSSCCAGEDVCDEAACGPVVGGDGLCCPTENICGEPTCGPGTCGDGCCDPTETYCGCPADCAQNAQPVCITIRRGLLGDVADAFLSGDAPNTPTGDDWNLWIGKSAGGSENRSIYRFDLSPIPPASTITAATLRIWLSNSGATATITAHPLLAPWSEATVTTNNYSNPAFIDAAWSASFHEDGNGGYKGMDVKTLVAAWVSGARPNHGVLLSEPPIATHHTISSESSSQNVRPKLEVCYLGCPP